ncbi:MAG: gamma-butyrobetaine hydroxylase-like domain-containing protein [Chthoniobacterales bacterium]
MIHPTQIHRAAAAQKIGNELAIAWEDGSESFFELERLRRYCPCASCGGEPDVLGRVIRPHNEYTPASFDLIAFEVVGGYALQPTWGDGHRSGIYSWNYLKRLSQIDDA